MAAAGATIISSLSFEDPGTLVRARGSIDFQPLSFGADLEITGAFGMGMVSAEALGIGVTACPEPFSDADWGGWMVWTLFSYVLEVQDATGLIALANVRIEIDSKAMRKVEPSSALIFIAESQAGAFTISEKVRVLQLLH